MGGFRVPAYIDLTKLPVWQDRSLKPLADSAPYVYYPGFPGPVTALALEEFKQMIVAKMMMRVLSDIFDEIDATPRDISPQDDISNVTTVDIGGG